MNFLAHAYLSGDRTKILIGNLAGDFIKGKEALSKYDREIIRGVELHRAIDEFTDGHAIVHESKARLRAGYRHYAGVIVDVFYDHFLAAEWHDHHTDTLENFAAKTYRTLTDVKDLLPASFKAMLPYMVSGNWLVGYRYISGIHRALSGMASRTPYESNMEHASKDLEQHYDKFRDEFRNFFPELKQFVNRWWDQAPGDDTTATDSTSK